MQWLAENAPDKLEQYLAETGKQDVWKIASQGFKGAHFATFPPKLIEPMILAGTSEMGCCGGCGKPYRRLVDKQQLTRPRPNDYVKRNGAAGTGNSCANSVAGVAAVTVGWEGCGCGSEERPDTPCVVLDPFVGSGTTLAVANRLGRRGIGIDLSESYLRDFAVKRIEAGR